MKEKNKLVLKLIDDIKKQFENNGYNISKETYEKIIKQYLNSDKSFEKIKIEIYQLVERKIQSLKRNKEKSKLKNMNINDYQAEILTIQSLDKYGYPNIINSQIEVLNTSDIGHNAPKFVKFGNKNGFYKNSANTSSSSLDKFEFIICQIGKMLNVKMAETYKVYKNNEYLGIISENVCDTNETLYMYSNLSKFIDKNNEDAKSLIKHLTELSKKKIEIKSDRSERKIPLAESEEDIKYVIDSFLQDIKLLNVNEEEQRKIRQDYFNMIMLDFIVNNIGRNKNKYGLIISEYGEVSFSNLFDNATISIPGFPERYQQINGFVINKENLVNCLFNNYYEDIKFITTTCTYNRESLCNKVYNLCSSELTTEEQEWFLKSFNENLNMIVEKELSNNEIRDEVPIIPDKEVKESKIITNIDTEIKKEEGHKLVRVKKEITAPANNDGKINVIIILLGVSLILILITLIILFKVKL